MKVLYENRKLDMSIPEIVYKDFDNIGWFLQWNGIWKKYLKKNQNKIILYI